MASPQGITGSTMPRRQLGRRLRDLRNRARMTTRVAARRLEWSEAKIWRIETGQTSLRSLDVEAMCKIYGAPEAELEPLTALARETKARGWWAPYSDVIAEGFDVYIGLEEAATEISTFENEFVPGLLQTEDFARAVIQLDHQRSSADDIERRVALRMTRQQFLSYPDAPDFWAVVDEAALRRPVGSQAVLRAQLRRLVELAEQPNITLQIVAFGSGGHAAAGGPFTILRFAEPDLPDIVYLEQLTSALYLDKVHDTDHYLAVMDRLCVQAESPADTIAFLHRLIKES